MEKERNRYGINKVLSEEVIPSSYQQLTAAFSELTFTDQASTAASVANRLSSLTHSTNGIENRCFDVGSWATAGSSSGLQHNGLHGVDDASHTMELAPFVSRHIVNYNVNNSDVMSLTGNGINCNGLDAPEFVHRQVGSHQPIGNYTIAEPLDNGMQRLNLLSGVPVARTAVVVIPDQQQRVVDGQSLHPYVYPSQLHQSHMRYRNFDEEQYAMHQYQHHLYLQQLHTQHLPEARAASPDNGSIKNWLTRRDLSQPYFEMPTSHLNELHQEPSWNRSGVSRAFNLSNPVLCPADLSSMRVFPRYHEQTSPEQIFSSPQELHTLKDINHGSANGSSSNVTKNGKWSSKGHFSHSSHIPEGRRYCTYSVSSLPDKRDVNCSEELQQLPRCYDSFDEIKGKVHLLAKDQSGCRFLQENFVEGNPEDMDVILCEIINHVIELMMDTYGNYLVQKLLEVCTEDQRMQILQAISSRPGELVRISCDIHGTRVIQKVIETIKTSKQISMLISGLRPGIVTLMKSMNGNHVAQSCLRYLPPEFNTFLFEAAAANCVELATDPHGCCVLKKCLMHSSSKQQSHLVCQITSNALILSQDPFGNYVVQFIFELGLQKAIKGILDQLKGNYSNLSVQKYSSNVVEKCLKYADGESCARIIQELINSPQFDQIMQDPYGNYVIQAALDLSKGGLHGTLVETIKPHIHVLQTSPYGKKVLSCIRPKK